MLVDIQCTNCSKLFQKQKKDMTISGNNFCCRSCSNMFLNTHQPKKRKQVYKNSCIICRCSVGSSMKYCKNCRPNKDDDLLKKLVYTKGHRASAFSVVRARARYVLKKLNLNSCQKCGYDKHIEACHIKSICSFSDNATIGEINDISNLLALCPNCHWEFDNQLLTLETINSEVENRTQVSGV